jgi:hypothetical protein
MHRFYRHFLATFVCATVFSLTGMANGLESSLMGAPPDKAAAVLVINWMMNAVFFVFFSMIVLAPVTSVADYLFTRKWQLPFYLQIPALAPLLVAYLFFWSLLFGRLFYLVLCAAALGLIVPLWVYWGVFRVTDRESMT